jgi:hypothetical protein
VGHIIHAGGKLSADPEKLKAITDWPQPKSIREVQALLGLINFYRKFIRRISDFARTLHDLLQKDKPFHFGEETLIHFLLLEFPPKLLPITNLF